MFGSRLHGKGISNRHAMVNLVMQLCDISAVIVQLCFGMQRPNCLLALTFVLAIGGRETRSPTKALPWANLSTVNAKTPLKHVAKLQFWHVQQCRRRSWRQSLGQGACGVRSLIHTLMARLSSKRSSTLKTRTRTRSALQHSSSVL